MEEDDIYIWVEARKYAKVQAALRSKVKGDRWRGRCGRGLVDAAVRSKSLEMLQLVSSYEDIYQPDGLGWTALHSACDLCLLPAVNFLATRADAQALVNLTNKDNVSPLHLACQRGSDDIVRLLLRSGAYRQIRDVKGQTPRNYAVMNCRWSVVTILDEAERMSNAAATATADATAAATADVAAADVAVAATATAADATAAGAATATAAGAGTAATADATAAAAAADAAAAAADAADVEWLADHNPYEERAEMIAAIARENNANNMKDAYTQVVKEKVTLTNVNIQLEQRIRTLTDKYNQVVSERDSLQVEHERQVTSATVKVDCSVQTEPEYVAQPIIPKESKASSKPKRSVTNELESLLLDVANNISPMLLMQVGIKLGLSKVDVEHIEASHPRNSKRWVFEALHAFASRKVQEVDYTERSVIFDLQDTLIELGLGEAAYIIDNWVS